MFDFNPEINKSELGNVSKDIRFIPGVTAVILTHFRSVTRVRINLVKAICLTLNCIFASSIIIIVENITIIFQAQIL